MAATTEQLSTLRDGRRCARDSLSVAHRVQHSGAGDAVGQYERAKLGDLLGRAAGVGGRALIVHVRGRLTTDAALHQRYLKYVYRKQFI